MFAMELAKLPPPTPARQLTRSSVGKETPGSSTIAVTMVGTSSRAALTIVQLRPPNLATANVYGSRTKAPSAVGSVVSRNLPAGSMPNTGSGRNSTITDHRLQIENPMCSEKIEKNRLRRATRLPVDCQNSGSSGRQSSIHRPPLGRAASVVGGALACGGRVGAAMATTVATAGFHAVAPRLSSCSVSLTAADPLW